MVRDIPKAALSRRQRHSEGPAALVVSPQLLLEGGLDDAILVLTKVRDDLNCCRIAGLLG